MAEIQNCNSNGESRYYLPMASESADTAENNVLSMNNQNDIEGASTSGPTEYLHKYQSTRPSSLACEYTREDITNSANQLIDNLNNKRKQDTELLDDFKKNLEVQVQRTCTLIEQRVFKVYEHQGKEIQAKIQDLFSCLERIAKVEAELSEFREALRLLYQDMNSAD